MRKRQQSGCICRKGDWWILRYRQPIIENHKRRSVLKTTRLVAVDEHHKTRRSVRIDQRVQELIGEILASVNKQTILPQAINRLGEFVTEMYLPYVKVHKRPSTYKGYRDLWEDHLQSRCGAAWLRDVRACHVQRWLDDIGGADGLSKTTLGHTKHLLSGIFNFARQQGYFDRANPAQGAAIPANAPKAGDTYAYSLEEVEAMLKTLSDPAATIVAVAAFTGLRRGELRGLLWDDYAPAAKYSQMATLRVSRSIWGKHVNDPKTPKSKAPVPVIASLAARLDAYRAMCGHPSSGPIFTNSFGRPLDLDGLYQREMKKTLSDAAIAWHGWHSFRRGLATNLHRLGVDDKTIQAILRHSNIGVTQNAYIKTVPVDAVLAMQRLENVLMFPICSPGERYGSA